MQIHPGEAEGNPRKWMHPFGCRTVLAAALQLAAEYRNGVHIPPQDSGLPDHAEHCASGLQWTSRCLVPLFCPRHRCSDISNLPEVPGSSYCKHRGTDCCSAYDGCLASRDRGAAG